MLNTKKLEALGLEIQYEEKYVGEGNNRRFTELRNHVRSIYIPLSPVEWCELCMRNGHSYIGGCCGQTSVIQDCFNSIFREGGNADSKDLLELAEKAAKHEGFELYQKELNQEEFDKEVENWENLNPIDKIGLCYQAVKDRLHIDWMSQPKAVDIEEDPLDVLYKVFTFFQYESLFTKDTSAPNILSGQEHGNSELLLARFLPAYRHLDSFLSKRTKLFEGFAVYWKETDKILKNGYGLCIYYNEEDAKKIIEIWCRSSSEKEILPDDFVIKSVKISMNEGLIVQ